MSTPADPPLSAARQWYAVRRTDGQPIGEFSWLEVDGPDDWATVEQMCEYDETVEYEIAKITAEPVATRTLPTCREIDCDRPAEHWGLCEPHAREDDPSAFDEVVESA